jgi:hypothetical protein
MLLGNNTMPGRPSHTTKTSVITRICVVVIYVVAYMVAQVICVIMTHCLTRISRPVPVSEVNLFHASGC